MSYSSVGTKINPLKIDKTELKKISVKDETVDKQEYEELDYSSFDYKETPEVEVSESDVPITNNINNSNIEINVIGAISKKLEELKRKVDSVDELFGQHFTDLTGYEKIDLYNRLEGLDPNSLEFRNTVLNFLIETHGGYGTREAVCISAEYLAYMEEVPYFWGGKRTDPGVDTSWGEDRVIHSGDSRDGEISPWGLDCSGFVTWAIDNAGFEIGTSYTGGYIEYASEAYDFTVGNLKSGNIKPGDLLYKNGHIAMIAELDIENNRIVVIEEFDTEHGMVVTDMTIEEYVEYAINNYDGMASSPLTKIYSMEDFYNNDANKTDKIVPHAVLKDGSMSGETSVPNSETVNDDGSVTYRVKSGDSLSEIAEHYNIDINELAEYNNIENINDIEIGQQIIIPPK